MKYFTIYNSVLPQYSVFHYNFLIYHMDSSIKFLPIILSPTGIQPDLTNLFHKLTLQRGRNRLNYSLEALFPGYKSITESYNEG